MGLLIAAVGINVLFHYLLKAPTHAGRVLLDQVEGFKMFLAAVDKDQLVTMSAVEQSPAAFEKHLPYAVALGVEKAWAARFASVLNGSGKAAYSPAWYTGDGSWDGMNAGLMAASLGTAMSSAIATSAGAPGISSGFGGGIFRRRRRWRRWGGW